MLAGFKAGAAFAQGLPTGRLDRLGLQLYTVRDLMKKSVPKTLALVAKAGYREVEFAGYFNTPVIDLRKMLDDNGLISPSSHIRMADTGPMLGKLIDEAKILGQKYLTVAWIDAPDRTPEGYRRIADRFNEAGLRARGDDKQLAYHNNAYEFTPFRGGYTGYDILIRECDPLNVAMEADIFWMRQARQDALAWFAKYPGRFHLLHLKDMGPAPGNQMRSVGKGGIDWRKVLSGSKAAGTQHFIVENEETKQPLTSIADSYRYLKALRFSRIDNSHSDS